MKLGEALSLRARQAQKLNDLKGRIKANSLTQEDANPAEDPVKLIEEYVELSDAHGELLARIAATNHATKVRDGDYTLARMFQDREKLIRERNIVGIAADAASPSRDSYRYMRSELKFVTTLNVAKLRAQEDELTEQVRALDARIQEINWKTDLI